MLINLRNALMTGRRLPYDAEVEFLESTGTQWIDTGLAAQRLLKISIDAQMIAPLNTSGRFGGFGGGNTRHHFYIDSSGVGGYAIGGSIQTLTGFNPLERFKLTYNMPSAVATVDGLGTMEFGWNFGGPNPNYTIFAFNDKGTIVPSKWRIYSFEASIYNSGTKISLVPYRRGNVGCMYDTISGEFFYNANTDPSADPFLYGPDKNT
jgi:hypothetical protein